MDELYSQTQIKNWIEQWIISRSHNRSYSVVDNIFEMHRPEGSPRPDQVKKQKGNIVMIDFYSWSTPNGRKVSIMLEECKIDYNLIPINITKDEQFEEKFLQISPNNKIPAIYDNETNISMMESFSDFYFLN